MVAVRLSQLQKRILRWLAADHHRTHGVIVSSHEELVKALGGYKGNISRSLQTLVAPHLTACHYPKLFSL
jgi:hypothetical protein